MLKRNLVTSLLLHESLRTTKKRAGVIAPEVEKLITFAKTHTPQVAIRHINQIVTDTNASKKVMEVFVKRYANRQSGMTRIEVLGYRGGDGAEVVNLKLIEGEAVSVSTEKELKQKKPSTSSKSALPAVAPSGAKAGNSSKKKPAKKSSASSASSNSSASS